MRAFLVNITNLSAETSGGKRVGCWILKTTNFPRREESRCNSKAETKLHDLKVAVGYPNETQSFFQIRDRSVIVISKKDYPILYCSFLA